MTLVVQAPSERVVHQASKVLRVLLVDLDRTVSLVPRGNLAVRECRVIRARLDPQGLTVSRVLRVRTVPRGNRGPQVLPGPRE